MTLIKSISGIRGTIGGSPGDNLTPLDVVKYASAYGMWLKSRSKGKIKVVVEFECDYDRTCGIFTREGIPLFISSRNSKYFRGSNEGARGDRFSR